MSNVTVSMKMSPKQAGALYMKCMKLEDRIAALEHSVRELCGVISEYQALPDRSLLKAMVATKDRHSERVNNDEPPQQIGAG